MSDRFNESAQAGADKGIHQQSAERSTFSAPAQSEADRNYFSERSASSAAQSEQLVASGNLPQLSMFDGQLSRNPASAPGAPHPDAPPVGSPGTLHLGDGQPTDARTQIAVGPRPLDGSPPLRPDRRDQHPTRDSRIRDGSEGDQMPVPPTRPGRPVGPMLAMEPLTGNPPLRPNPRDQHPTRDSRIYS